MKKVIFTQEWIALHPYEKADETDLYYTELANEIYHALDEACYTHNFKNMDEAKHLEHRYRQLFPECMDARTPNRYSRHWQIRLYSDWL